MPKIGLLQCQNGCHPILSIAGYLWQLLRRKELSSLSLSKWNNLTLGLLDSVAGSELMQNQGSLHSAGRYHTDIQNLPPSPQCLHCFPLPWNTSSSNHHGDCWSTSEQLMIVQCQLALMHYQHWNGTGEWNCPLQHVCSTQQWWSTNSKPLRLGCNSLTIIQGMVWKHIVLISVFALVSSGYLVLGPHLTRWYINLQRNKSAIFGPLLPLKWISVYCQSGLQNSLASLKNTIFWLPLQNQKWLFSPYKASWILGKRFELLSCPERQYIMYTIAPDFRKPCRDSVVQLWERALS